MWSFWRKALVPLEKLLLAIIMVILVFQLVKGFFIWSAFAFFCHCNLQKELFDVNHKSCPTHHTQLIQGATTEQLFLFDLLERETMDVMWFVSCSLSTKLKVYWRIHSED